MLSLATSLPAWADAPIVIGPIHDEGSAFLADCGAFQIIDDYDSNFTVRRMRDRNGTVIRLIEEVWGVDNFRNSVTGYSIPGPYHNNTFVDLQSRTAAIAGIIFRAQVPGVGSVVLDLGRVIVDREDNVYFSAGPHQFLDGDIAALCAALE
jgi:hypothetical protein